VTGAVHRVVHGRVRDLGGFAVRRVLPSPDLRTVGPFVFFDHIGPTRFAPGAGLDVRPHPHIGLATVTYLFEGEFVHRDSLGNAQLIRPGDVNWMVAGRGIAHSERTPPEGRSAPGGAPIHGLQTWVGLPVEREEIEPSFEHHPAASLPQIVGNGAVLRVVAGTAYGRRSPVSVYSPTLYVAAELEAGAELRLPDEHAERAVYVAEGEIEVDGERHAPGAMRIFETGVAAVLRATQPARLMLLGGVPLGGPRHLWWNFVSSREERIEQAKVDWRERRFAEVPGDDERIPLPDR